MKHYRPSDHRHETFSLFVGYCHDPQTDKLSNSFPPYSIGVQQSELA